MVGVCRQIASRVIAEWMRIDRESDFSAKRRFQLSDSAELRVVWGPILISANYERLPCINSRNFRSEIELENWEGAGKSKQSRGLLSIGLMKLSLPATSFFIFLFLLRFVSFSLSYLSFIISSFLRFVQFCSLHEVR